MSSKNFQTSFVAKASAEDVFNAVNAVTKWWTENLEGGTTALNDEFTVQFGDVHFSRQKLVEFVPGKKVVWLVTESKLSFVENKEEWTGNKIVFEVMPEEGQTRLLFTQIGLDPGVECYKDCSNAWTQYVQSSLYKLVTTGVGQPEKKEKSFS